MSEESAAKPFHLFHAIGSEGGPESSLVRKYLVDHNLSDRIEFHNVAYEGSQKKLREMTKQHAVPCLVEVAGHRVFVGVAAILDRLAKIATGP